MKFDTHVLVTTRITMTMTMTTRAFRTQNKRIERRARLAIL